MQPLIFAVAADVWDEVIHKFGSQILMFIVSTGASFVLGRWWGNYRARQQWEKKEFLGRINISLNSLAEQTLKIRTILERSLDDIFLNPIAIEMVKKASLQTTLDQPMLPIPKEDCWFLLNFVLNAVAEHFSVGMIRQDAGEPVHPVRYAVWLTCEVVGEERIRKVRAMLLREELLRNFPYLETVPKFENPWHEVRLKTLRQAVRDYQTHPEHFLTLELCV